MGWEADYGAELQFLHQNKDDNTHFSQLLLMNK